MIGTNQPNLKEGTKMKLSTIILSSIIALVPLNVLAQGNWQGYPQWARQRSNPPQFVVVGDDSIDVFLVDKKLIPLGSDKYGFITREQRKQRSKSLSFDYHEFYGVMSCSTGEYDLIGFVTGDSRGGVEWYKYSPDPLWRSTTLPDSRHIDFIHRRICPKS